MGAVCVARKAAQGVFSFVCLFVFPFAIFISCFHFLFLAMGNSTSGIVQEPPVVTAKSSMEVLTSSRILSSRSIHRHPFHLPNLKGSQITRGAPLSGGP